MTLHHLKQILETKKAHETLTVAEIRELLTKPSTKESKGIGSPRGEQVVGSKLTAEKVRAIRQSAKDDMSFGWSYRLAEHYGVTPKSITRIVNRQSWKHID